MARRKDRYPTGTHGADSDFRFDQIEHQVASELNDRRRKEEYEGTYAEARKLLEGKKSPEVIRQSVCHPPHLQEFSAEDSARMSDWKKAHNRVENALARLREQAVEDALAGRKPVVPDFRA